MSEKRQISTGEGKPAACYSPAIACGDMLYVSGQVGESERGEIPADIAGQTKLAIENAEKLLRAAGSSLDRVVMCRCFLRRKEDFAGMNAAYGAFFGGERNLAPARYTVVAPPVEDRYLVEIAMLAGL